MRLRLRARYALILVALTGSVLVLLTATILALVRVANEEIRASSAEVMNDTLLSQLEIQGRGMSQLLATNLTNVMYNLEMDRIQHLVRSAADQDGVDFAIAFDQSGKVLHDGTETLEAYGTAVDDEATLAALATGEVAVYFDDMILYVAAPVKIGSVLIGGVTLGLSTARTQAEIANQQATLASISRHSDRGVMIAVVAVSGGMIVFALLLSMVVARGLSRPIGVLSSLTRRIGVGEYDFEVPFRRSDEIGDLAQALQGMAGELKRTTVSKNYFDNILNSMLDPLLVLHGNGTIETANPAACRVLGYEWPELIGRHFDDVLVRDGTEEHGSFVDGTGRGEKFSNEEGALVKADGTRLPALVSGSPMAGAPDRAPRYVCVARDVSEHAELEERLRHAQRLEAIGSLTGGVAHEFNNLLAVIIGNAELLQEHLEGDRTLQNHVRLIDKAASRGADLTQRLLAFSRKQPLRVEHMQLNTFVRETTALLEQALGETVTVKTALAEDLWPINADAGQIQSALLNVAINARDAMLGDGVITIRTKNVTLDGRAAAHHDAAPGEYVELALEDTGRGMPPEVVARAFDPFFTTKDVGKGTGLGLSMVYGFVRQSGGFVEIESSLERGTIVRLYLPRGEPYAEIAEPSRGEATARPGRGERILVVEDDPDVRDFVVAALSRIGYEVVAAEHGPAALALMDKGQCVDLLFTDVVLPQNMSGREVADEVKRRSPGTKVAFCSGYSADFVTRHGGLHGHNDILRKPYTRDALARTVRAALDGGGGSAAAAN